MNYQVIKNEVIDWLIDNEITINAIVQDLAKEAELMLKTEPEFYEEIKEQYIERLKSIVGEEISRQLGMPIDSIYEVLESSEVQEYLVDDSLCFNDNSRESASE